MKIMSTMDQKEPAVIINTPAVEQQSPPAPNKKYKIAVAVLAAVTVVAVVAAFVGVFYIHAESVQNIIKHQHFEYENTDGSRTKEDVDIDETDNVAKYRVSSEDGNSFFVIEDYDRKLAVLESTFDNRPSCSVYVLNTTSSTRDMEQVRQIVSIDDNTEATYYVQQKTPITQTNFLSDDAQKMCAGRNIYWAVEQCEAEIPSKQNGDRAKRGIWDWWRRRCSCGFYCCWGYRCVCRW